MKNQRELPPIYTKKKGAQSEKSLKNKSHKQATIDYIAVDTLKIETLSNKKLIIQTDSKFSQSIQSINQLKQNVLMNIIDLDKNHLSDHQCDIINSKGILHREANIINELSSFGQKQLQQYQEFSVNFCDCGCNRMKGKFYPLCLDMQEINILGSSIVLYFLLIKHFTINILIFAIFHSLFAIITNSYGNLYINTDISKCTSSYCYLRDQISSYNKPNYNYLSMIQGYLGLAVMIIWGIYIRYIKYYGTIKDKIMDMNLASSSDYAIKINNLPYGEFNEEELIEYLEKLFKMIQISQDRKKAMNILAQNLQISQQQVNNHTTITSKEKENITQPPFLVGFYQTESKSKQTFDISDLKSIQIIYNMQFSRKLLARLSNLCLDIKDFMVKFENKTIIKNKQKYLELKTAIIETYEIFFDLRKKFLNDGKFRKQISTRTAIIEFKTERSKDSLLKYYGREKITFFKEVKLQLLNLCFGQNSQLLFKGSIPSIIRAPEPSDIIWTNCEKKQSFKRILIIYFATFCIILISFGMIFGLEYLQAYLLNIIDSNSSIITIINIFTSLVLQIINKVLWFSLFYLLDLEYNHTKTNKIISQMNKTSFLMWVNIIILPIMVNYIVRKKYFGSDGVSGIVFDYHISALTAGLIVKFIDPVNFIFWVCLSIKTIRNYFIKAKYKKKNQLQQINKEAMMAKIYSMYQGPQFDIAESYVFIISNVLHAFFFCQLQPFIIILVLFQSLFFYWICKFRILRVCKIPSMTDYLIFEVAAYQIMLVPIFYGVGSLFNSYVSNLVDENRSFQYISAIICIIIGSINYFNPFNCVQFIIDKFIGCFNTLDPHNKIKDGVEQKTAKIQRMENYYKNSNSLTLLGYEKLLAGQQNLGRIQAELKRYCFSSAKNTNSQQFQEIYKQSQIVNVRVN